MEGAANDFSLWLDLRSFASSSKTQSGSSGSFVMSDPLVSLAVHRAPTSRLNILSCGFPKIAPPPTFTVCVLSGRLPKGASSASRCYTSDTFHPCRSSRLRWFTPQTAPQACCILQPVMGFEPFPIGPPFRCVSTSVGPPSLSLVRSSHPSKRFPF